VHSAHMQPRVAAYADRVRENFAQQGVMHTIGACLGLVQPGAVDVELDWSESLTQQHGFLHAGVVATALDSACGYAGFTLMAEEASVLTVEFKINLLAPARGHRFRMEGRVIKPGKTITVCEGRAFAFQGTEEKLIATMGCTLMAVTGRDNIQG
jgi:uncharacterized protein (TIGR00369 family)